MRKKIIQYILLALTIIISFFSFLSVYRAINIAEASVWLAPIIWFSLFFIIIGLDITLVKNKIIIHTTLFLALLPSLVFSFNIWHLFIIIFGFLLLSVSRARIQGDINYGRKIKLGRSLRFGKSYIFLTIALVISSQYYFSVKDDPVQKFVPDLKIDGITSYLTPKILSTISPNFSASIGDDTTVDQFTIQMQEGQLDKMGNSPEKLAKLLPDQREEFQKQIDDEMKNNQDALLEEGRKKFSDLVGRSVSGTEKVSVIFSEVINNKINNYFKPGNIDTGSVPVASIVTLALFLTIMSLGSFLGIIMVPITAGIFIILIKLKLVSILKVTTEAEIIDC